MSALTGSPAWQALASHRDRLEGVRMRDLFERDPERATRFSARLDGLLLDYSKNRITQETISLLLDLARQQDVAGWRGRMFAGRKINTTEDRAALRTALPNRSNRPVRGDGRDVMPGVNGVRVQMGRFSQAVRDGACAAHDGRQST